MREIGIVGGGGHAKVIMDIILKNREIGQDVDILGFFDDDLNKKAVYNIPNLGPISDIEKEVEGNENIEIILGIGDNVIRRKVFNKIDNENIRYFSAIHPSAVIGNKVNIGEGTVIVGGAVINVDTDIGEHCIINTSASVGHDIIVGDFVHISPGARLTGEVKIYDGVHIGTGAVIVPGISIGENSIIGAGAVVTEDIPSNCTAVGVPAKPIKFHDKEVCRSES